MIYDIENKTVKLLGITSDNELKFDEHLTMQNKAKKQIENDSFDKNKKIFGFQ